MGCRSRDQEAAMPICGKNPLKVISGTKGPMIFGIGCIALSALDPS